MKKLLQFKNLLPLLLVLGFTFRFYLASTNESGPQTEKTGAPSESNCTACHSGSYNTGSSKITLSNGASTFTYTPGTTYHMQVDFTDAGHSKFGFEATALKSSNNNMAGYFNATNSNVQTDTSSSLSRGYIKHTSAGTAGSSGSISWNFDWIAPSSNVGDIDFYVVVNSTNSSNSDAGDTIYQQKFTMSASSSATPLSGNYFIGNQSGDYASFNDAVADLIANGVSGATTFQVRDGSYNERVSIPAITGASSSNTITFTSLSADSTKATLYYASQTNSTKNYLVQLNGASYITFNQLTFERTGSNNYAKCINLGSGASNNKITNNVFIGVQTTPNLNQVLVNSANISDAGNAVINNKLTHGSYAVYFRSNNSGSFGTGNTIKNNTIDNPGTRGIYVHRQENCVVSGNKILGVNSTMGTGIDVEFCGDGMEILRNEIHGAICSYGIQVRDCNGSPSSHVRVANNMIMIGDTTLTIGISTGANIRNCNYVDFVNNSVLIINKKSNTTGAALRLYRNSSGSYGNITVTNNLLTTTGGAYAINVNSYAVSNGYLSSCNYNDLFSKAAVGYWAAKKTTLAQWKTASGFDNNSYNVPGAYLSTSNLHLNDATLDNQGTNISWINNDIDLDSRSGNPDIGCDEFTYSSIKPIADVNYHNALKESANLNNVKAWYHNSNKQIVVSVEATREQVIKVRVSDLSGKAVYQTSIKLYSGINESPVSTTNLKNGIYLVSVFDGTKLYTSKILIQ